MTEPVTTPGSSARPLVHEAPDHEELILFLERDQLVADTSKPVKRAQLSPRISAALWSLRIFVLVVGAMVIYTFVHQLR
ncbi:MAG: hypothetical protein M3022_10810 [Actinomycetota bacterium]|nr:hypothetical protein [Actinomycetota bacterium]